ncbi:hypothetical protein ACFWN1_08420 [Streptomyces sp. NPDC058459]|uniref:hypothetical protein n=1 Tax=Streptomyces sp. NPDC058459 TaxID=3346508 RepID=UPI0036626398
MKPKFAVRAAALLGQEFVVSNSLFAVAKNEEGLGDEFGPRVVGCHPADHATGGDDAAGLFFAMPAIGFAVVTVLLVASTSPVDDFMRRGPCDPHVHPALCPTRPTVRPTAVSDQGRTRLQSSTFR